MRLLIFAALVVLAGCAAAESCRGRACTVADSCSQELEVPTTGYAAPGKISYRTETIKNPTWRRKPITVFLPDGGGKAPVIFYSHGFGATSWENIYPDLMHYMASRGNIVVYVPYRTIGISIEERYDMLWDGFTRAAKHFRSRMDLTRVGFVGHSFGGGATPMMAYKGFVEKGWGEDGRFMFIMAPWYSYKITQKQLESFPDNSNMVMQVYDQDIVNDHRMAIDIFRHNNIPAERKDFYMTRSDSRESCSINADHRTPGRGESPYLKRQGVFRLLGALEDYTFNGRREGGAIALGGGKFESVQMGKWKDASSFNVQQWSDSPSTNIPQSTYKYPWDSDKNPRR